jgi:hypothetical protein
MKTLVIGECPWRKNPFGYLVGKLVRSLSKNSDVVLLAEGHEASLFGDGEKSIIKNDGFNEIEVIGITQDISKSSVVLYEIYKSWKFDIIITVGHLAKFEWVDAFFNFSQSDARWGAIVPENFQNNNTLSENLDSICSFNGSVNFCGIDNFSIYPELIWDRDFSLESSPSSNCVYNLGLIGENTVLSNFHICEDLKKHFNITYFSSGNPRSYYSEEQLKKMGVSIYPGFRIHNFWDNDNSFIDFINYNDGFILLDDVPDFGFYSYVISKTNKPLISSCSKLKCGNRHIYVSAISLPSNNVFLDKYHIFKNTSEITLSLDIKYTKSDLEFSLKKGDYINTVELFVEMQSKLFTKAKRIKELRLEIHK